MKKHILAVLLAALMVFSSLSAAFAAVPEDEQGLAVSLDPKQVDIAEDFNEFTDLIQDMKDGSKLVDLTDGKDNDQKVNLKDTFQTGRLIVRPDKPIPDDVLDKATKAVSFLDYVILQFGNKQAAKDAYEALRDVFDESRVIPDAIFKVDLPKAQNVKAIEPIDARENPTTGPYLSWGIRNMGMDKVKAKLAKRSGKKTVKVAVIDTGINYMDEVAETGRIKDAFDTYTFLNKPQDFNGHGTFCAGVILESTPNNVKVVPVKVITGTGLGSTLNIVLGVIYAMYIKADVLSMSLGGINIGIPYMDPFFKEIRNNKGCIVVAAGNEKDNTNTSYPACWKYVITVGATRSNNKVDKSYSNYGKHVDFVAPGTDVGGHFALLTVPIYAELTGTSMATPHIAAACALVKTAYPNYGQQKVYNVLKSYAIDIGDKGRDNYSGWGRVDLTRFAARL